MDTVTSSRRNVMRALAALSTGLPTLAYAASAPNLVCVPTPSQDQTWLALLDAERRAAAVASQAAEAADEAFSHFSKARASFMEGWQAEWDEKFGRPHKFIDARPEYEHGDQRVSAGIADYNAFPTMMKEQRDKTTAALNHQYGVQETEEVWSAAHDTRMGAIKAIIAYPSRDPDIIAHKLDLLIEHFGDEEGDLTPLLTSIVEA